MNQDDQDFLSKKIRMLRMKEMQSLIEQGKGQEVIFEITKNMAYDISNLEKVTSTSLDNIDRILKMLDQIENNQIAFKKCLELFSRSLDKLEARIYNLEDKK